MVKPGYKQTEVGKIPEDWDVCSIGTTAPLQRGFDLPTRLLKPGSYPVAYSNGIQNHHAEFMVKGPGIFTGRSGTIGKVHYVSSDYWPHNTTLWVTNFKGNHPKYIYYLFSSLNLSRFSGGSGVPTLNRNDIHEYLVVLPKEKEQEAIAEVLSDVDELIVYLEKLINKKRDIKTATMQQLLTGKKRLPGFSGEWEEKTLQDIGDFRKGKGIKKDQILDNGIPCIRYGEIYTRHNDYIKKFYSFISEDVASESTILRKGDLIFAGSGETTEEIGKCVAFLDDFTAYAGGDTVIFSPIDQDSKFLGYLMNHESIVAQKSRMGQGDAVVHIHAPNLAKLQVHLPKLSEQQAIAELLSDLDKDIAICFRRLKKIKAIKQGMMQELLTGRTRLIDAEAHEFEEERLHGT